MVDASPSVRDDSSDGKSNLPVPGGGDDVAKLRERLAFYESFDTIIRDNVDRAGQLLREAASSRERADEALANAEAETEKRKVADKAAYRAIFSSLLDEVTTLQGQLERLARRVADALDEIEADLPPGPLPVASSSAPAALTAGEEPIIPPKPEPIPDPVEISLQSSIAQAERVAESDDDDSPPSGPTGGDAEILQTAVEMPALADAPPGAETEAAIEQDDVVPSVQASPIDVDEVVAGAENEADEIAFAAPNEEVSESSSESEVLAVASDALGSEPPVDPTVPGALSEETPGHANPDSDESSLSDSPVSASSQPSEITTAPHGSTTLLVHGVPRATTALSLKRYLEGLTFVESVEPREYAEGILRLQVIGARPLALSDLNAWSDGSAVEPIHLRDDLVEIRLPRQS
jgi:hypothetical protein